MSERIRSLEYAYRASGEACDLLAWVHARLRAGEFLDLETPEGGEEPAEARLARWVEALAEGRLEPEQLELAAFLGDPLARLLDEERAVSLATYLGEGLELVPLVLGDEADEESTARWIAALKHWSPSWVAEAQLSIAAYHLERYPVPEAAVDDAYGYYGVDYMAEWRATLDDLRLYLEGGLRPTDSFVNGYGYVAELIRSAQHLALGLGDDLSWVSVDLGPEPAVVPECVRRALLSRVLRTC
jgi:hypothetical protein